MRLKLVVLVERYISRRFLWRLWLYNGRRVLPEVLLLGEVAMLELTSPLFLIISVKGHIFIYVVEMKL